MNGYFEGTDGICPHCGRSAHFKEAGRTYVNREKWSRSYRLIASGAGISVDVYSSQCPSCGKPIVAMKVGQIGEEYGPDQLVYPSNIFRFLPPEVPEHIKEDFLEATAVLTISQKASAALSRRCLQNVLLDQGVPPNETLSRQIDWAMRSLPGYLAENIDYIRNVGNFAAHPIKNTHTGEIVEVEEGEAEFNLDVLEELFDHYYVKPTRAKSLRNKIDTKLQVAGKLPMKKP